MTASISWIGLTLLSCYSAWLVLLNVRALWRRPGGCHSRSAPAVGFVAIGAIVAAMNSQARAHFVFVVPDASAARAQVILSEDLMPDDQVDVGLIGSAKLFVRDPGGKEQALTLTREKDAFVVTLNPQGASVAKLIHGTVDLGVTQRGEGPPNVLMYHPKTIIGDAFSGSTELGKLAPVELVPVGAPGAMKLRLIADGKPQADAEVTVLVPGADAAVVKTDASGLTPAFSQRGRFGAWARYWVKSAGERDGKKYDELRHYATIVFDIASTPTSSPATATPQLTPNVSRFTSLPEGVSSFGAVASNGWLYIYGGHIAPTHEYHTSAVSGRFSRLNLADGKTWEQLPGGKALQGMNLAAHAGKIYLVGGMEPRNKQNDPTDNYSIADSSRFDPATGRWEALPPLPLPRSSHDLVVIGNKLMVVGGWWLKGANGETEWPDSMAVMDLAAPTPQWTAIAQPFHRRALIAAANDGKLYVIGGFNEDEEMSPRVDIFDPQTVQWSRGPDLPAPLQNAFGPAATTVNGRLIVSVGDGSLLRMASGNGGWEKIAQATPRIVHRLAPLGSRVLVIGGAAQRQNLDLIEAVTLEP